MLASLKKNKSEAKTQVRGWLHVSDFLLFSVCLKKIEN